MKRKIESQQPRLKEQLLPEGGEHRKADQKGEVPGRLKTLTIAAKKTVEHHLGPEAVLLPPIKKVGFDTRIQTQPRLFDPAAPHRWLQKLLLGDCQQATRLSVRDQETPRTAALQQLWRNLLQDGLPAFRIGWPDGPSGPGGADCARAKAAIALMSRHDEFAEAARKGNATAFAKLLLAVTDEIEQPSLAAGWSPGSLKKTWKGILEAGLQFHAIDSVELVAHASAMLTALCGDGQVSRKMDKRMNDLTRELAGQDPAFYPVRRDVLKRIDELVELLVERGPPLS